MDARRFDTLTRTLTDAGTRRGLLTLLATLPVLGGLFVLLASDELEAKGRRKRRKKPHHHRKKTGNRAGKQKKRRCNPEAKTKTCQGTCGSVKNNCKQTVDCGSCACTSACAICEICQAGPNTPGECVPDPATQGEPCGSATCSGGVFTSAPTCDGSGACQPGSQASCAPYSRCNGNACASRCASNDDCVDDSFCNGDGQCVGDQANGAACQHGGDCLTGFCVTGVCCNKACDGACEVCNASGDGTCTAVEDGSRCGDGALCCDGSCVTGDCCESSTCGGTTPICANHSCTACSATNLCPEGCCDAASGKCQAACPTCQTCDDGVCIPDSGLFHTCSGPCPSGQWCDAGACAGIQDTVRIPDCQSLCNGSTEVCGQTVNCPSCGHCGVQTGCSPTHQFLDGPVGPGLYCSQGSNSLTCDTNAECAGHPPDSYCTTTLNRVGQKICARVCPY